MRGFSVMKDKQNTEQLKKIEEIKKEFKHGFDIPFIKDRFQHESYDEEEKCQEAIWNFFLPHLISSDEIKREADDKHDPVRLGTFVSDLDRFNAEIDAKVRTAREDVYWSIIKREVAESGNEPKRLIEEKGQNGYTEWLKSAMKHASWNEVGLYKILARADETAKKEILFILTQSKEGGE